MAKLALNKSSLSRKKRDLEIYARFLPPLDLKRRHILAERSRARIALADVTRELQEIEAGIGSRLPMMSNRSIVLDDLVSVTAVRLGEQNIVGVTLPLLEGIEFDSRPYGFLAKPHWVDQVAEQLRLCAELHVRKQVLSERLLRLETAAKKLTQRVNLFDKVLIPRTRAEIKDIEIFLSDADRAAVVRSKIAKKKHAESAR